MSLKAKKRGFGIYVFDSISDSESEAEEEKNMEKKELAKLLPH